MDHSDDDLIPGVSLHLQLRDEAGWQSHQTSRVEGTERGRQGAEDLNTVGRLIRLILNLTLQC